MEPATAPGFDPLHFYLGFSGRINRRQFWLYGVLPLFLVQILIQGLTGLLLPVVIARVAFSLFSEGFPGFPGEGVIKLAVIGLAWVALWAGVIWVNLALQVKRWHDRGKSAWWLLVGLVPIAGAVWCLVELGFLPGTPSRNRYGSPP